MLWYKGWLETRFRLLFGLAFAVFFLGAAYSYGLKTQAAVYIVVSDTTMLVAMFSGMLAGAGISTQPAVQATKGLHGSMMFTVSLPVSRLRLLATRAGLGWLEMAGAIGIFSWGMWSLFPVVRGTATPGEMLRYSGVLLACGSALHAVSVLLATFLDDLWRMYGSMLAFVGLWWLPRHMPLPDFVDIFRAMGERSPLLAHTTPWTAMGFSLVLAAVLFFASLKIVQTREY